MTQYFNYVLSDPRTMLPFYVGKGSGDRHLQHIRYPDKQNNAEKARLINEIHDEGLEVHYYTINRNSEAEAFAYERLMIQAFGIENLTNLTLGGDQGPYQGKPVDQYDLYGNYIQSFKSAVVAATFLGKPEQSTLISRACKDYKNCKRPFGYIWCYSGNMPNFEHIWKTVRPIEQYNLNGELIGRFPSASQAAKTILNNVRRSYEISQAARKGWECKGYRWKFIDYA